MPAACGIACEVCVAFENGICPGCVAGTNARAPEMVEWLKGIGVSCPVLECAIENRVDYCLRCENLPCDVLYKAEHPYTRSFLDLFKLVKDILKQRQLDSPPP